VFDEFGYTHDYDSIQAWLKNGKNICPLTGDSYSPVPKFVPDRGARSRVHEWATRNHFLKK